MSVSHQQFLDESRKAILDINQQGRVQKCVSNYHSVFEQNKSSFSLLDTARQRAANIRSKSIEYLDSHLIDFEAAFIKRGGKVIWAGDESEAQQSILHLLKDKKINHIVKSKSSVCAEIHLSEFLGKNGIDVIDTDLGDYLAQLFAEPAFHPILPVMQYSAEDIVRKFNDKKGTSFVTKEEVMVFVKSELREKINQSKACVTGANFLLADTGSVSITENEGNVLSCASVADLHIVVTSIDKILPSVADLDLFLPLLSLYGTGQSITAMSHLINGPRVSGENQAPGEMVIVLIDNGRSALLEKTDQRKAATCIHCSSCLNNDPVFRKVGGHSYQLSQKGAIGSITSQHLADDEEFMHLSYSNPTDGSLKERCPVAIDFNRLLLYNRRDNVSNGLISRADSISMFFWKNAVTKRSSMEKGGSKLKNFMLRQFFRKSWGEQRELPKIAPESFNEQWQKRKKR